MRFYGLHTGRNNMASLLVRSYYYNKPKTYNNYNDDYKKNIEESTSIQIATFIVGIIFAFILFL